MPLIWNVITVSVYTKSICCIDQRFTIFPVYCLFDSLRKSRLDMSLSFQELIAINWIQGGSGSGGPRCCRDRTSFVFLTYLRLIMCLTKWVKFSYHPFLFRILLYNILVKYKLYYKLCFNDTIVPKWISLLKGKIPYNKVK